MNAKHDDLARIQEIYDVICRTKRQMSLLGITYERFAHPESDKDDLLAEGIMNRVLRVTEEAGHLSAEVARDPLLSQWRRALRTRYGTRVRRCSTTCGFAV